MLKGLTFGGSYVAIVRTEPAENKGREQCQTAKNQEGVAQTKLHHLAYVRQKNLGTKIAAMSPAEAIPKLMDSSCAVLAIEPAPLRFFSSTSA